MKVTDLQLNPIDVDVISGDSASGLVLVGEGVEQALVTVDVQTDGVITGQEALTLTVGDPEEGGGVLMARVSSALWKRRMMRGRVRAFCRNCRMPICCF